MRDRGLGAPTLVIADGCAGAWAAVVESPFATVLIWTALRVAERRFRRPDTARLPAEVYVGETFVDGLRVPKPTNWKVAA